MPPDDGLRPRPGPPPRLIEGPRAGGTSLYHQRVLDEDTYTEALSNIIQRDFFPSLPHLNATNDYLSALANNDHDLLRSSIRRLARIAQEKEDGLSGSSSSRNGQRGTGSATASSRRVRPDTRDTPLAPHDSTPFGAQGWDTPRVLGRRNSDGDVSVFDESDEDGNDSQSSRPPHKRRRENPKVPRVRDDLSLGAFQANYTSEDNASFAHILEEENAVRRADKAWAFETEQVAEHRRALGEERRRMILDAAANGWRVDGDGRRRIGALAEPGREKEKASWIAPKLIATGPGDGEGGESQRVASVDAQGRVTANVTEGGNDADASTSDRKRLQDGSAGTGLSATALVKHNESQGALVLAAPPGSSLGSVLPPTRVAEVPLPSEHPLSKALEKAGLPTTALVSTEDGAIVPHREVRAGAGEGRGRGEDVRRYREQVEREAMGEEREEVILHNAGGVDQWAYKTLNPLMFPPDSYEKPYPKPPSNSTTRDAAARRHAPPKISHANTRMPEEDDEPSTAGRPGRRGSVAGSDGGSVTGSIASSWVDAAVKGEKYVPREERDGDGDNYSLVDVEADLEPEDLPPLMTFGTLLATPRALDGSSDSLESLDGPSFRLPERKRRDELGRKLGAKASKSIAERARAYAPRPAAPSTPSMSETLRAAAGRTQRSDRGRGAMDMLPPSTPKRADALTPAAKSLLQRTGRTPQRSGLNIGTPGRGSSLGSALGGLGAGARARGAAMEKSAGWARGKPPGGVGGMSWTPGR